MIESALLRTIRERRSVVRFGSTPVTDEQLETILEAGRWAPSNINCQPWQFIVVRDAEKKAALADVLRRITIAWQGFAGAPLIVVVAVDAEADPLHFVEDGAAAAQNMALAAHALGLATCWAGLYAGGDPRRSPEEAVARLLGIPARFRLIAALPVGHAAYQPRSERRPLAEIVHRDGYAGPDAISA